MKPPTATSPIALTNGMRRCVIADDDAPVRLALIELFATEPDLRVVASGADADETIALCLEHRPEVLVVDVNMPGGGGERAARVLAETMPDLFIVAFSADSDRVTRRRMAAAGAHAFVPKGDLGQLVHLVANGRR